MFKPHGVIPALVTPLTADGEIYEKGLRDVIDFVIAGGVHGIFVLGSSGEIYGLSAAQKRRVVELTVEHVNGRVPIYAGASEITTRGCIATAAMVKEVGGVSALSVLTPYFMTPTQTELVDHFRAIADSTDDPIILYTNPGRTKVNLTLKSVLTLAEVPNIIGLKDSAGDMSATADVLSERPDDFCVLIGRDTHIYSALALGAEGAIASTANVAPALVSGIYTAFAEGNTEKAIELQRALAPLRNLVDKATFPVVLKEGLKASGIDAGHCFAPARELSEPYRSQLHDVVADIAQLNL